MNTHYRISAHCDRNWSQAQPRTIRRARTIVRNLAANGFEVVCDRIEEGHGRYVTTRIFRNRPGYELDVLHAFNRRRCK